MGNKVKEGLKGVWEGKLVEKLKTVNLIYEHYSSYT